MVRLLASLVALSASFSAFAQTKTLAVYLNQPLQFGAAGFEEEVRALIEPSGYRVVFRNPAAPTAENFDRLMMVNMEGRCSARDLTFASSVDMKDGALASTATEGSRVLPFTKVFCDRTVRLLTPALSSEAVFRRDLLFARALARQVAHELFHFLAQDKGHSQAGVAKACLQVRDLLAGSLPFDEVTVSRLSADEAAEDTGR